MDDVAAVAGVSRGTVSRVLNGGHNVSKPALDAVQRAIRKTGYVVNQHARSLVTQRSHSVAFVLSEPQERLFEDPNFHVLLRGCTQSLAEHDITLVMTIAGTQEERRRVSRYVTSGHVDGALLVSTHMGSQLIDDLRARAASLVVPGTAVAISAGTTTVEFARRLVDVPGLTVVTNSIPVADVFYRAERADRTVVLTGGVRTPSDALVGPVAIATIAKLHVDLLFLGVHGMSERAGFTTPNLAEAETARALVTAAGQLIVLADHTKWGVVGLSEMATLDEADVVVTDTGLPPRASDALSDRVGDLLVAEVQA